MASGTKSKGAGAKGKGKAKVSSTAKASTAIAKPKPWGTILIVIALVAFAGGVFGYAFVQINENNKYKISEENKDPSENIDGVVRISYEAGKHVKANQRVAYDQSPPFGGPHDEAWASCEGFVYASPVRNENMIHMLEHGAVWIAYNPEKVVGGELDKLRSKVTGQNFLALSPYPGLDRPISLQSWGHQLKVDSADDERIDQFVKALKRNQYQNPEPNSNCTALGPGTFDPDNPPPFDASPPPADAVKMDGTGATQQDMAGGAEAPPAGQQPVATNVVPPAGS
jgi:hypothetical protein